MSAHNAVTTEMLEAVLDGIVPPAKAESADSATTAQKASALSAGAGSATRPVYIDDNGVPQQVGSEINVNISGTAASATNATYAQTASSADTAGYATTAKGDANGNDIAATYATNADLTAVINGDTPVYQATNAVNATNDGAGQNISSTYSKVADVQQTLQQLQNGTIVVGQATNATNAANDGQGQNIVATYATKTENAAKLDAPTVEQFSIPTTSWTALSGADPFTVSATVTATTPIGADATIELYNDQPVAFSQYCFSIASVSGQTLTIYALETPTSAVTLTVGITN